MNQVRVAAHALHQAGYVDRPEAVSGGLKFVRVLNPTLTERGRREVGAWPPSIADGFLMRLEHLILNATDPDERTRWETILKAAKESDKAKLAQLLMSAGQIGLML